MIRITAVSSDVFVREILIPTLGIEEDDDGYLNVYEELRGDVFARIGVASDIAELWDDRSRMLWIDARTPGDDRLYGVSESSSDVIRLRGSSTGWHLLGVNRGKCGYNSWYADFSGEWLECVFHDGRSQVCETGIGERFEKWEHGFLGGCLLGDNYFLFIQSWRRPGGDVGSDPRVANVSIVGMEWNDGSCAVLCEVHSVENVIVPGTGQLFPKLGPTDVCVAEGSVLLDIYGNVFRVKYKHHGGRTAITGVETLPKSGFLGAGPRKGATPGIYRMLVGRE